MNKEEVIKELSKYKEEVKNKLSEYKTYDEYCYYNHYDYDINEEDYDDYCYYDYDYDYDEGLYDEDGYYDEYDNCNLCEKCILRSIELQFKELEELNVSCGELYIFYKYNDNLKELTDRFKDFECTDNSTLNDFYTECGKHKNDCENCNLSNLSKTVDCYWAYTLVQRLLK